MLKGVFTAIVTPFNQDESVNYEKLAELIEFNIENGVSGIVPCGTTGESPTLTHEEKLKIIKKTVEVVNGRVKVIAGTGSNCTKDSIEMSKEAEKLGVDALLLVNPYYNKPTQEGLYRHFKAIADAVKIECVLYNIKGRSAVNLETETLIRLEKDCANINTVKEASGDLNQMKDVIARTPDTFSVLSGDDGVAVELVKMGGHGVISVASNVIPNVMVEMVSAALEGTDESMQKAEKLNSKWKEFFSIEFIETNPIPAKYMLFKQGKVEEVYRLPICPMSNANKEKVDAYMSSMGLL
jgi:4-hydroxy-tetrahydrodipicolinate synthase